MLWQRRNALALVTRITLQITLVTSLTVPILGPWQTSLIIQRMEGSMSFFGDIVHTATKVVTAPVKAVEHVASDIGHAASDVGHAVGSGVSTITHTVENVGSSAFHTVVGGVQGIYKLGVHEGSAIGSAVGHSFYNMGSALGHGVTDGFNTVKDGVKMFGSELGHTASNFGSAIGHGASAIGGGFIHTAGDIFGTGVKLGGDAFHTVGNVSGDLFHAVGNLTHGNVGGAFGDLSHAGKDAFSGAGHIVTDTAHGAANVAGDVGHTVTGFGHAVVEGGGALASGALQMGGTTLGVAGDLFKNYEHTMGTVLVNGVDAVGAIAKGEVAFGYGTAGIIAHTVGTPVGDFYANVAKHYGDAAIGTLDHVNKAIDDAVNKGTSYGGDLGSTLGHGADKLGHDGGQIISDISHGNFTAAAHDIGHFGSDLLDAGKQFAGAEKEGVEALAAVANAINTTLNGLNEAMARAGGGFVSAVGDTIGGHAGHMISDAGDGLGKATAMTSDLMQGNVEGAAKEGAKELGGLAGEWVGEQVKHAADDLGNKVGGVFGDAIKALGGAAADGLKDLGKSAAGAAADKGLDFVKGGDNHAPNADNSGNGSHTTEHTANNDSLFDKALHAAEQAKDDALHKATDLIDKVTHDPQTLLNMAADAIKDHLAKDPGDAFSKLFAANLGGSHAHTDAHAADGTTIGTSHAALTAESHDSAPTFAGDSVESLFAQHNVAGAPGSHGAHATLQDVLHLISLSELNPDLLSSLHGALTGHSSGSEANLFGSHDLLAQHQPEAAVPHVDGGMLMHSDMASTSHNEHAHQLFG